MKITAVPSIWLVAWGLLSMKAMGAGKEQETFTGDMGGLKASHRRYHGGRSYLAHLLTAQLPVRPVYIRNSKSYTSWQNL
jgi:hypothetical protein